MASIATAVFCGGMTLRTLTTPRAAAPRRSTVVAPASATTADWSERPEPRRLPEESRDVARPVSSGRSRSIQQVAYEVESRPATEPLHRPDRNARPRALDLLAQARIHLDAGRMREAWMLAGDADQLAAHYELWDDRPELIRRDIELKFQGKKAPSTGGAAASSSAATPAPNTSAAEERRDRHRASETSERSTGLVEQKRTSVSPAASPPPRTLSRPKSRAVTVSHMRPGVNEWGVRRTLLAAKPEASSTGDAPPTRDELRLSFNFQQAPWDVVLRRFAQENSLSLQMETVPPGTLTYSDPKEYPPNEVLDLLSGFLLQRSFVLVRRGESLIVVDASKGVPHDLPPEVPVEEIEQHGRNEVFTVPIPVLHTSAQQAARDIQPFLGPLGSVVPLIHTNRIIVTDTGHNIRRIHRMLMLEPSEPNRPVSAVYPLRNTNAVDVAKAITDFLSRLPGGPGAAARPEVPDPRGPVVPVDASVMVVAEARTNSLLVSAPPNRIDEIYSLICRLDRAPAEVVIQAMLVEVELANTDEFGVEVGVQDSVLFDRSVVNNILTVTESVANPATGIVTSSQKIISQTANPGFNFNNQPLGNNVAIHPAKVGTQGLSSLGTGRVNGDLGYGGLVLSAGSESLNVMLRALSEKRKVDVLSRPQIRAIDNRPAEIQIGQQVPVVDGVAITAVGSANPVIRQDKAGIILTVTPHIRPDGQVVIDVTAEKSAFNLAKGAGVPIFTDATNGNVIEAPVKDITQAKTSVSCLNGQTIVLGGMITKHMIDVQRKVPFLGDIPYLGYAFRYTLDQTSRRELLIFLTPQIIRDPLQDSERLKQIEVARTHFPASDAMQMHGPLLDPPATGEDELDLLDNAGPGPVPGRRFPDDELPAPPAGSFDPPGAAPGEGPNLPVPPPPQEAIDDASQGVIQTSARTTTRDTRPRPVAPRETKEKRGKSWIPWKKEAGHAE